MRTRIKSLFKISLLLLVLVSCSTQLKTSSVVDSSERYAGHIMRDSIYLYDSIYVRESADTVFIVKNSVTYRDKLRTDTLWCCDTVVEFREIVVNANDTGSAKKNYLWCFAIIILLLFLLWKGGWLSVIKRLLKAVS